MKKRPKQSLTNIASLRRSIFLRAFALTRCALKRGASLPLKEIMLRALVLLTFLSSVFSSTEICEKIDGDCPESCQDAGFEGSENFNALFKISPTHPSTMLEAYKAEKYIKAAGDVSSTDNVAFGLHTSVYYFCCYTTTEKKAIIEGLSKWEWDPISISYDSFGCNLDHDGKTVYLHGMPSDEGQSTFFDFARGVEKVIADAGAHVEERKTLFHMTLARVDHNFPTDDVVNHFLEESADFGTLTMDKFVIDYKTFRAKAKYD
ncbi:hypothetical protein TrRE_jg13139 [Triparma retinervis]|uniref:Uncharacterized protein n=1 Tax=Triparma retinervis TaxID=2557542 RepID=A0A9W7AMA9_9STRA|nr:hypothetical protein TrRE_jg13139 [Triparma retinervis]